MNKKIFNEELLHAEKSSIWDTETEIDTNSEEKWEFLFHTLEERVKLGIASVYGGHVGV